MISASKMKPGVCAIALFAATFSLLGSQDANAAGCNGVINPAVWGCAPWDNNNGPKYPNYKKPGSSASQPSNSGVANPGAQPPANGAGIISRDGAGIISNDGASIRRN